MDVFMDVLIYLLSEMVKMKMVKTSVTTLKWYGLKQQK